MSINLFKNPYTLRKLTHFLFLIVLAVGVFKRFSLPLVPFMEHDTVGYLGPASNWITYHQFGHFSRSFVYPLTALLGYKVFGSISFMVVLQHTLGILGGIIIYLSFDRSVRSLFNNRHVHNLISLTQISVVTYYLLANSIIYLEHTARVESIAWFLMISVLSLLVHLVPRAKNKTLPHSSGPITRWGAALFLLLSLVLILIMPKWLLTLPAIVAISAWLLWKQHGFGKQAILQFVWPLAIYLLLFWLPENYLVNRYGWEARALPHRQFFYTHMHIIKPLIEADLDRPGPFKHDDLQIVNNWIQLKQPGTSYPILGHHSDSLMQNFPDWEVRAYLKDDYLDLIKYYNKKCIVQRPHLVTAKIMSQCYYYFSGTLMDKVYWSVDEEEFDRYYNTSKQLLSQPFIVEGPFMDDYRHLHSKATFKPLNSSTWVHGPIKIINRLYLPLLIVYLALIIFYHKRLKQSLNKLPLVHVVWILVLLHVLAFLSVAIMHTIDIKRYWLTFIPFWLIGFGVTITEAANIIVTLWSAQSRQKPQA